MGRVTGAGHDHVGWIAERAIVLQILRDDHDERWDPRDLSREISDLQSTVLVDALERLGRDGILHRDSGAVWASQATRRLDELEMISI